MTKIKTSSFFALLYGFAFAASAMADDPLLPPETSIEKAIDHYIGANWKDKNIKPGQSADDFTWLRRVTLDLVGRIPTPLEARSFAQDKDPAKKTKTIDLLMKSSGHIRHQTREFEYLLMNGTRGQLVAYLGKALGENRSWDKIFRELLVADESNANAKGASEFLKVRVNDLDRLTNDVSVAFFGVNVSCAQCHDHPVVHDWKQDHFFGMKSFFSRTYEVGTFLAEREYGVVRFLPNKGKEKQADYMFLTGKKVEPPGLTEPSKDEQKKEKEKVEKWKKEKTPPPKAKVSTRAMLVDLALSPKEQGFLSRAIINQLWNRFYGQGLVMPLDQMHSENPASHPELLAWLDRDFVAHHFDLSRLVRGMVSSETYALSSKYTEGGNSPLAKDFAVARLRPLTPMQLAIALRQAGQIIPLKDLEKKTEEVDRGARGLAEQFQYPNENFQIGVTEALFLSNSSRFQNECLPEGNDKLVTAMVKEKSMVEKADMAIFSVYARPGTPEEKSAIADYLKNHGKNELAACRQVVWSLMASPEFRFNH